MQLLQLIRSRQLSSRQSKGCIKRNSKAAFTDPVIRAMLTSNNMDPRRLPEFLQEFSWGGVYADQEGLLAF